MAASNEISIDLMLLAQIQSVVDLKIPQEIIGAIVDELEDSSLHAFCLATTHFVCATQARIFRSLQICIDGPSYDGPYYRARAAVDYRRMAPWQAERLFMSSPHLALYVKRLWIDIPRVQREVGAAECYLPLQTVLPVFTTVRHLEIGGPAERRWVDLPQALKDTIQSIVSLPSIEEIQFSALTIPAALIRLAVQSAPVLTLVCVVVEDAAEPASSSAENLTLQKLTIVGTTLTMVDFLTSPGAPSVHYLSDMFPGERIPQILQVSATTLTHLRFCARGGMSHPVQLPHLSVLRVLELERSENTAPMRLPELFVSLLKQIPSAMPRLERVELRVTVASVPLWMRTNHGMQRLLRPGDSSEPAWTWAHSGPLDLGTLPAVHCLLRFHDRPHPAFVISESRARERELLRKEGYAGFVRCMEELLPALRDNGGLSFSQIYPSAYT
ncbi:hypothetical protein C8R45DRAFT_1004009, partial [Mycena sanguinolenta]